VNLISGENECCSTHFHLTEITNGGCEMANKNTNTLDSIEQISRNQAEILEILKSVSDETPITDLEDIQRGQTEILSQIISLRAEAEKQIVKDLT
jgi:hypothetical protein